MAAPTTAAAPPGGSDGLWGTAGPLMVAATSPDGRWLAYCTDRGTPPGAVPEAAPLPGPSAQRQLFFAEQPGPGEPIDDWVGADPLGRHVALVRGGRLVLRDTWRAREVDLSATGADARDDARSYGPHRAGSFDGTGRHFLYLRTREERSVVVLRELSSGAERELDPGEGLLWRADFDAMGQRVVFWVVTSDTNKNGKLGWPAPPAMARAKLCHGATPSFQAWELPGDRADARVATLGEDRAHDASGLLLALGDGLLSRRDDALLLARADGTSRVVADKRCAARVLHADPRRNRLLYACTKGGRGRPELHLVGPSGDRPLGVYATRSGVDEWDPRFERLVAFYPTDEAALVDLDRDRAVPLPADTRVVATWGSRALLRDALGLRLLDVDSGRQTPLGPGRAFEPVRLRGPIVVAPPFVVDLARGEALGRVNRPVLDVTTTGWLLLPSSDAGVTRLPVGPLRWWEPDYADLPLSR